MTKLLNTYKQSPTIENARRLAEYDRKHPMAACLLSPADAALLKGARVLLDWTQVQA